jgi:hypothetical protein
MILIRRWPKTEITNPYENLGQIYKIRKYSENMPTTGQNGVNEKPNFFVIRKFGLYVEVGSGFEYLIFKDYHN